MVHRFGDRKKVKIQRPVVRCAALHAGFLAVLLFLLYQPQGLRYCVIQAVAQLFVVQHFVFHPPLLYYINYKPCIF